MRINGTEFSFGADPEVFMRDAKGNEISAWGKAPGTKKEPFKVQNGAFQVDGTALEFNIDPAQDYKTFAANIQSVKSQLEGVIEGSLTEDIQRNYLPKQVIKTPEAFIIGCDPQENAWGVKPIEVPSEEEKKKGAKRFTGGHVHIGYETKNYTEVEKFLLAGRLAINLDFLILPYEKNFCKWDPLCMRRNFSTPVGSFRMKPYGMEYRAPTNFWIWEQEKMENFFNLVVEGIKQMFEDVDPSYNSKKRLSNLYHQLQR